MQQDYCAITLFNTRLLTMNTIMSTKWNTNQKSYNLIKNTLPVPYSFRSNVKRIQINALFISSKSQLKPRIVT